MTASESGRPAILRVMWPIGLSFLLVIAVSLVTRALGPFIFPLNLVFNLALLGMVAVGCLGSASRLYFLLWRRNATVSPPA